MLAIRHSDFSQSFAGAPGGGLIRGARAAFEEILQRFRAARTAKEEQASYLDTFVRQCPWR